MIANGFSYNIHLWQIRKLFNEFMFSRRKQDYRMRDEHLSLAPSTDPLVYSPKIARQKREEEKSVNKFKRALSLPGKKNRKPKPEKQQSFTAEDIEPERREGRTRDEEKSKNEKLPIVTKLLRHLSVRDKSDQRHHGSGSLHPGHHSSRSTSRTRRHKTFSRRDSCCAICKSETFFLPAYTERTIYVKQKGSNNKERSSSL